MPYIIEQRREEIRSGDLPRIPGELNWLITEALIQYVKTCGLSYGTINDIKGALIGAKDEFERRVAGPYEEKAIERNGDVYSEVVSLL